MGILTARGRASVAFVVTALLLGAFASGQELRAKEVTCPVDGHKFTITDSPTSQSGGGTDSDLCEHQIRGRRLPYTLTVCPRCNYANYYAAFERKVPDDRKAEILRRLSMSRYRGVKDSLKDIPGWERFRLGATCARILGEKQLEIQFCLFAVYSARTENCKPATVAYSSPGIWMIAPISMAPGKSGVAQRGIGDVIDEIEKSIVDEKSESKKNRLRLHLVMMFQRGGFAARRDRLLKELEPAAAKSRLLKMRLETFTRLVRVETEFQEQSVTLLQKRLEKTDIPPAQVINTTFVLADTLRRLDRKAEAVEKYRAVRRMMSRPVGLRKVVDNFLNLLAPGEPLPKPAKLPKAEPETTTEHRGDE